MKEKVNTLNLFGGYFLDVIYLLSLNPVLNTFNHKLQNNWSINQESV